MPPTNSLMIRDYDPSWPGLFEAIKSRIAVRLDGLTAAIVHVGSTAVPGLAGKPIIDIDVLLKWASDLPLAIAKLASTGYEYRGDLGITGREAFRTPPNDFPHHLYVCLPPHEEHRRHILFRNYLRTHPEDANAYACLKRDLAGRLGDDRAAYTQAKSGFIAEILQRAGQTQAATE